MYDPVEIRRCRSQRQADELALVLAAVGIGSRLVPGFGSTGIQVSSGEAARAVQELAAYEQENRPRRRFRLPQAFGLPPAEPLLAYAAVLFFVYSADLHALFDADWKQAGAAGAGAIQNGEWWRTLTALTLHGSFQHLLGNLVFGIVFALLLAQRLGSGVAWFAIVVSGAFGNAFNAALLGAEHASVGASTAIFGALGALSAFGQARPEEPGGNLLRRWAPVAAGAMLLAFLGVEGERTDVTGHLCGFAAGLFLGFALARLPTELLRRGSLQWAAGAAAIILPAFAWLVAFTR